MPGLNLALPRAALIDWDNTLVDSFPVIHRALNDTFAAFGMPPWSFEETCRRIALSMRDSFPARFGARWREASEVFYAHYAARHLDGIWPLPGAEALLDELSAAGTHLGVVSNKNGDYLRDEVRHLGWGRYFAAIVGAGDAEADKPAPAVVDFALAGSGIAPGREVWFVGDNAVDVACAERSGCVAIVVAGAVATGEVSTSAAARFAGLGELAAAVRRLRRASRGG